MNPPPPNNDHDNNDADAVAPPVAIVPFVADGEAEEGEEEDNNNNNDDDEGENNDEEEEEVDANDDDDDEEEDDDDDDDEEDVVVVDVATLDLLDPDVQDRICTEALTLLQNRSKLPSRLRNRTMVRFAQQFIANVKEDIYETLTDMRLVEDGYDGFDSERDTKEEVETAIRSCPEVLTRRDEHSIGRLPIQCLTLMHGDNNLLVCNVNAVSFVPLVAKLAIEFNSFEEHERGGLLIPDEDGRGGNTVLHDLMYSSDPSFDEEHHERVDTSFLAVLVRLRHDRLFTKNDIQQHQLVHELCKNKIFANQRFRFLTEIDPASLLQTDENGLLPLHWATYAIHKFRPVCDAVFRYYPKWKGIQLLHQKETVHAQTPFQLASHYFGHTAALTIVDETLARYSETVLPDIPKALILAASEERIHVECVYFLLKRQPDITISTLQQRYDRSPGSVLASSSSTNSSNRSRRRTSRNTHNRIVRRSTRKRKRN